MIRGIILAGGSGKRMWPLSREKKPKQLLKLFLKKTFLEESVERLSPIVDSVTISTGKNLVPEIKKLLPDAKLIVEPERRDTAAAIGLCATHFDENDVLVFTPSDAYIHPNEKFQKVIKEAIEIAQKEQAIVVVGITPTKASTSYGYIEPDEGGIVKSFKEKPEVHLASKYVKKGFLWNGGIFIANAGVILELFKKHEPEIYSNLMKLKNGGNVEEIYPQIKKISFDFAVMEKAKKVFFVKSNFYWNDVGGFPAVGEIVKEKNVVLDGKLIEYSSKGNIISTQDGKTIALIDCENLVVIDTPNALLVCPKSSCERIKKLVEEKVVKELQ